MRLEPSEESMYRRMDLKDHFLILIPVMGLMASLGFFFMASPSKYLIGIVAIIAGAVGLGTSLGGYLWLKQRIMPLSGCFLEIRGDSFVTVQPYKASMSPAASIIKRWRLWLRQRMERDFISEFCSQERA